MDRLIRLYLLAILGLLASCGSIQRVGVSSTADIIYQASAEMEKEGNWELFKTAVPSNLKLLEGLLEVHGTDKNLLVSLIKGYTGYAFAVHETLHLEELWSGSHHRFHYDQALQMYTKALNYGLRYLELEGVTHQQLLKSMREVRGINKLLSQKLHLKNIRDREAVLFTAQALGSLINMQRTDMTIVAQLPVAKEMFDWVCEFDPQMNFGACAIFQGAYEAGRPVMMGGNPELSRKIFIAAIEENPHNWLVPLSYIQLYALPLYKEELYQEWKPRFEKWSKDLKAELNWSSVKGQNEAVFAEPRLRFYQALAIKRFELMKKYEKNIF